jgi:S-(hydroxymethyl)glutathione dehydrogenase/alcohol dehydrogenase
MKAALMREFNKPLVIENIQIDKPGPREVLVRTVATGVCHSDLHCIEGGLPVPPPMVLGHEPAGVVEQVGADVTHVKPGDHVIGCLSAFCANCNYCMSGRPYLCGGAATARTPDQPPRLSLEDGTPLMQFAHLSSFAEQMLLHENALVKVREDMPLEQAALIGCGVTTGLGAALNTARVRPGDTCAVIACGGVGLSVIQGARIAGAGRIIAVDTVASKLHLAEALGATDSVDASDGDAVAKVLEMTGGGVDFSFECIGSNATCQQSVAMIKKGGTAVFVGVVPIGVNVELPGLDLVLQGKTIKGSIMGENRFREDMPRYADFYLDGRLRLDELISARLPLDDINQAFDTMRTGEGARNVIVFD